MRVPLPIIIAFLVAGSFAGCEKRYETKEPPWYARVDGKAISIKEIEEEMRFVTGEAREINPESEEWNAMRKAMAEDLIRRKLLLLEANRRNIALADDKVENRVKELYADLWKEEPTTSRTKQARDQKRLRKRIREEMMVEELFQKELYPRILVKDGEIREEFEKVKESLKTPEQVLVRQIVVENEEDAASALRRLYRGEPFAKVAREVSIMPEKDRGGDLGWVHKGKFPEFLDKLIFELPKYIINKPVKSPYGYHIIQIVKHRAASASDFEMVKSQLEKRLFDRKKQEAEENLMEQLHRRYEVVYNPNVTVAFPEVE